MRDTHTWDHVVPRSKGGTNDRRNLVHACQACNSRKDSLDLSVFLTLLPTTQRTKAIKQNVRPSKPAPVFTIKCVDAYYCGICKLKKKRCHDCS